MLLAALAPPAAADGVAVRLLKTIDTELPVRLHAAPPDPWFRLVGTPPLAIPYLGRSLLEVRLSGDRAVWPVAKFSLDPQCVATLPGPGDGAGEGTTRYAAACSAGGSK